MTEPSHAPIPVGAVDFGDLRRVEPIGTEWGYDRGSPVDRYYIERFLARNAPDVRGRVLEIGDPSYTQRFGGDNVHTSDVLHVRAGAPGATIISDLEHGHGLPSDAFDCVILTQTLQLVYDVPAAIATLYRILSPGGVVLATVPGISRIDHREWKTSWYWAFTTLSVRRLFAAAFGPDRIEVASHGNVLGAVAFLHGMAGEELTAGELDANDEHFQLLIAARAVKRTDAGPDTRPASGPEPNPREDHA